MSEVTTTGGGESVVGLPRSPSADDAPRAPRGVEIAAVGLRKQIKGGEYVLNGVSFMVRPCQLVAIVGGSGAGKTTLLEALAGVRPADSGRVRFDGVDLYGNLDGFRS